MQKKIFDVIMIGGGAAGMVSAIFCARSGLRVLILEGQPHCGSKLLLSGGSRCNLSHQVVSENDYCTENKRVRNVLRSFTVEETLGFFNGLGVETICDKGGKIFPASNSARSVFNALIKEIQRLSVQVETSRKVKRITNEDNNFKILGEKFCYESNTVVLCTGGLSYPSTGSDGVGFLIAQSLGHRIVQTTPALTSLKTLDRDWTKLSGVSFEAGLSLWQGKKKIAESQGSMLFTHFGFSGPAVLDISRFWIRSQGLTKIRLEVNFFPKDTPDGLRRQMVEWINQHTKASLKTFFVGRLPERLVQVIFYKMGLDGNRVFSQMKRQERERLIGELFYCHLPVDGALGYEKSEVTAGGVSLDEVDSRTLESKLRPGLFFAGEILDVDGRIGGFNLQWAWSSAVVVSRGVLKFK